MNPFLEGSGPGRPRFADSTLALAARAAVVVVVVVVDDGGSLLLVLG